MRSVSIVIVRCLPPVHKIPEGYNPAVKIHMGKNPCIQHGGCNSFSCQIFLLFHP